MTRTFVSTTALLLSAFVLVSAPGTASAQFSDDARVCRAAVAKAGLKLAKASLKAVARCHNSRVGDAAMENTDCNVLSSADLAGVLPAAESAFSTAVLARCTGVTPADALFEACPAPCADDVPVVADAGDIADCLLCLNTERIEHFAQEALGSPATSGVQVRGSCTKAVVKNGSRLFAAVLKSITKCQTLAEKSGATTTTDCLVEGFDSLTGAAAQKARDAIAGGDCASLTLPELGFDACEDAGDESELAACVADAGLEDGGSLVGHLLELPAANPTTTTTTTTTTLLVGDPQCPDTARLLFHSRDSHIFCDEDADCPAPRTCDLALERCRTATEVDEGWTGLAHDADTNDGVVENLHLYCAGPDTPACGQCTVQGLDPDEGSCRCSNDLRQACDTPFSAAGCPSIARCDSGALSGADCTVDADCDAGMCTRRCSNDDSISCVSDAQCPGGTCRPLWDRRCEDGSGCDSSADCIGSCVAQGGTCECFLGAPLPVSMTGTPTCIVQRFEENVGGTVNVDTGAIVLATSLRSTVYLGERTADPCPTCGGTCSDNPSQFCDSDLDCSMGTCGLDAIAGDGLRGGTCTGGASEGLPCDAMVANASFPAKPGVAGGGSYSLDCMPSVGVNISGSGLPVRMTPQTGSTQLDADLSCGGVYPELFCPCLQCTGDTTVPCSSNADCADTPDLCSLGNINCEVDGDCESADVGPCLVGISRCRNKTTATCVTNADCQGVDAGTCEPSECSSKGASSAVFPIPNQCQDLACSDTGGGEGECTLGPDDMFCDGVTLADGTGLLPCSTNADCEPEVVGIDAGDCTLTRRLPCFLDPIVAGGSADPNHPLLAATYCLAPTNGSGINAVTGRPGPARLLQQTTLSSYCGVSTYGPGLGCP